MIFRKQTCHSLIRVFYSMVGQNDICACEVKMPIRLQQCIISFFFSATILYTPELRYPVSRLCICLDNEFFIRPNFCSNIRPDTGLNIRPDIGYLLAGMPGLPLTTCATYHHLRYCIAHIYRIIDIQ